MAPLLPTVRVEKKQQPPPPPPPQQQQQEEARASSPFPAVLLVSLWGFLNAGFVTLGLVIFLVLSVINPCVVRSSTTKLKPLLDFLDLGC
jgi:hypothetical protein